MKFEYDQRLSPLLQDIANTIVKKLPGKLKELNKPDDPAYVVFLWYHDSTVFEYSPPFGVGYKSMITAARTAYPNEPGTVNAKVWFPQIEGTEGLAWVGEFGDKNYDEKCNLAYQYMLSANKTDRPLADEGGIFMPFRSMLHQIALHFNKKSWSSFLNVTDDFVFTVAEHMGAEYDDYTPSMLPEQHQKLKQKFGGARFGDYEAGW